MRALRGWRQAAGIAERPQWRQVDPPDWLLAGQLGDRALALIVKRAVAPVGADPSLFAGHSLHAGHSLRAGLPTSAAAGGAPERAIMRQTGHRSVQMVRRYIRTGTLFDENAAPYLRL